MKKIIVLNGQTIYASSKGLHIGQKCRALPAGEVLACHDKGVRRKIRKALRAAGFSDHASAAAKGGWNVAAA